MIERARMTGQRRTSSSPAGTTRTEAGATGFPMNASVPPSAASITSTQRGATTGDLNTADNPEVRLRLMLAG